MFKRKLDNEKVKKYRKMEHIWLASFLSRNMEKILNKSVQGAKYPDIITESFDKKNELNCSEIN